MLMAAIAVSLRHPGSICGGKVQGKPFVMMEGNTVFKFAIKVLEEVVHEALAENNLQVSDIDWLIPHQANIRIIHFDGEEVGVTDGKGGRHAGQARQHFRCFHSACA